MFVLRSGFLFALTGLLLMADRAEAQQKFAFIDSRIIVDRAPGRAAAEALLQKETESLQARVKVWQDSLAAMVEEYRKGEATMTAAQYMPATADTLDPTSRFHREKPGSNAETAPAARE